MYVFVFILDVLYIWEIWLSATRFKNRNLLFFPVCPGCMALSYGTELRVAMKTKTKTLYWKNTIITGKPIPVVCFTH